MTTAKDLEPYAPNVEGLVAILEDFRQTMPNPIVFKVAAYRTETFENVSQGDALYSRASDGKVGKAVANGTLDQATVAGFAETTQTAGQIVRVIVSGQVAAGTQTLDAGDLFFLSDSTAGAITTTPPSGAGKAITRVGEASTATDFAIHIEPPVLLR